MSALADRSLNRPRPPRASSDKAGSAFRERWRHRAQRLTETELKEFALGAFEHPIAGPMLEGLGSGSPFLADRLLNDMGLLQELVTVDPETVWQKTLDRVATLPLGQRNELMAGVRRIRARAATVIAWADLTGSWDLANATSALTEFADAATAKFGDHLMREARQRGEIELDDPERPSEGSGIIVIAMGKHGAFELNYSSDIDLVVLFDPGRLRYRGPESPMAFAVRFARSLGHLLEHRTRDGYVLRVDLRLRPHLPGHPLALSTEDAEIYYERHGQNWERAALIKARPVAGDIEAGAIFLRHLRPFIWRKHLDYAAIRDIHSIKRQINAFRGFGELKVWGHDLKVGSGGIREIEFFVQTQQLILGGQNPLLRTSGTIETLERLAEARWVSHDVAAELISAYRYLRLLEHRLQMQQDQQTQRMPPFGRDAETFAAFAGYDGTASLESDLKAVLDTVSEHYGALFEGEEDLGGGRTLVFTGTQTGPETLATLESLGFRDPEKVAGRIRSWHHGHIRATRSTRARELLTELVPSILEAMTRQPDIDDAFSHFDGFLSGLPTGVQLFSLIRAHPELLRLLTDMFGAVPRLARYLSTNTDLFEAMLSPDFFDPLPGKDELQAEIELRLRDARDLQDVLEAARRWAHGRQFQAGLHVVLGTSSADQATTMLTDLAEMILAIMLEESRRWLEQEHGRIDGSSFAILGLGKLGSRELTIGSDLDLVFVYEAPETARSTGGKALEAQTYFARLGQRLITSITAQTNEGRLFEIDTRLRPSGNVGPVACSLMNFESYNRETAQTWEMQALSRARVVAGDTALAGKVAAMLDELVCRERHSDALRYEVRAMRERIFNEHGSDTPWNLKHTRGGITELEFLAQYLQLSKARDYPELRSPSTREVFRVAGTKGLLSAAESDAMIAALRLQIALQLVLRLSRIEKLDESTAADGLKETLVRASARQLGDSTMIVDFPSLQRHLVESQSRVRQIFERECPMNAEISNNE